MFHVGDLVELDVGSNPPWVLKQGYVTIYEGLVFPGSPIGHVLFGVPMLVAKMDISFGGTKVIAPCGAGWVRTSRLKLFLETRI